MPDIRSAHREASDRARRVDVPVQYILPAIEAEIASRPIKVSYESMPEGGFMAVRVIKGEAGEQFVLRLNLGNTFIQWMLDGPADLRAQLETMLLVLAGPHARTREERMFFDTEMGEWGRKMEVGMKIMASMYPETAGSQ